MVKRIPGPDPVVVGVDGSPSALHAVRWAAREAVLADVPLSIVYACSAAAVRVPAGVPLPRPYQEALHEIGGQYLAEAAAAAEAVAPEVAFSTRLCHASAAPALIELSSAAKEIVVGSRGLHTFTGLLVGSTAVAVAAHGHCPLVVVRGEHQDAMQGPVVACVGDDATESTAVVSFASQAAALRGVPVVVVHDDRRRVLLREAADAQLVVVGARGSTLSLGSTSQALIYRSPCPVAVVPIRR